MTDSNTSEYSAPGWNTGKSRVVILILLSVIVLFRTIWLNSDAYLKLDWSAALLTDEGFYAHNARNAVLFGTARTDGFNNMLLSPILHALQWTVFRIFGVGMVQARSISVVCSLGVLWLMFAAMRRAFDNRVGWTTVVVLGLDHTNVLYNRLGLMDTPATLPAAAAFYSFVRASSESTARSRWLFLCGLMLCLTVATRNLCLYMLPVPFMAMWLQQRFDAKRNIETAKLNFDLSKDLKKLIFAVVVGVAAYVLVWYVPNRAEIAPMNHYYRVNQVQPHSVMHLMQNVQHAVVGDFRGVAPYLFRHTPVVFVLSLLGLARMFRSRTMINASQWYLGIWLGLGWLVLATISYSPSRYYVSTYPALAAMAAVELWRLRDEWSLRNGQKTLSFGGMALVGFCAFHAVLAVVHYDGVVSRSVGLIALYGVPLIAVCAAMFISGKIGKLNAKALVSVIGLMWLIMNTFWMCHWVKHLDWTQESAGVKLAAAIPKGATIFGDVAPGLTMNTEFKAIHVQPGLANWDHPIEKLGGGNDYIAILDGKWREAWWVKNYSGLISESHKVATLRVLKWDVGIYKVQGN